MQYITHYSSPLGDILLAADALGLTGLWFQDQKHYGLCLGKEFTEQETELLRMARQWLDIYFSGREPDFHVPLHFLGTNFQKAVWEILSTIPYGKTMTYGQIAGLLAHKQGLAHMSSQAVGGAVGRNPISILVPCHRVLGAGGKLTGYAGGLEKKRFLLQLEGVAQSTAD